jgi:chromosome segregation ATPase
MEDLGRLLSIALAVVSIATLAGMGLLVGRVGALRSNLKESDDELERTVRRLTNSEARVEVLEHALEELGRMVTGEAHLVALEGKLDDHHTAAEIHWQTDETLLREIRDRLPVPPKGS